ncbi:MAG: MBL fold metallo-hydrolase [Promethearchaeota archaeon]
MTFDQARYCVHQQRHELPNMLQDSTERGAPVLIQLKNVMRMVTRDRNIPTLGRKEAIAGTNDAMDENRAGYTNILIDAAFHEERFMKEYFKVMCDSEQPLDYIFLSHAHTDHYRALDKFVNQHAKDGAEVWLPHISHENLPYLSYFFTLTRFGYPRRLHPDMPLPQDKKGKPDAAIEREAEADAEKEVRQEEGTGVKEDLKKEGAGVEKRRARQARIDLWNNLELDKDTNIEIACEIHRKIKNETGEEKQVDTKVKVKYAYNLNYTKGSVKSLPHAIINEGNVSLNLIGPSRDFLVKEIFAKEANAVKNNTSLVLELKFYTKYLVFTGDAEKPLLEAIVNDQKVWKSNPNKGRPVFYFKMPHHGSDTGNLGEDQMPDAIDLKGAFVTATRHPTNAMNLPRRKENKDDNTTTDGDPVDGNGDGKKEKTQNGLGKGKRDDDEKKNPSNLFPRQKLRRIYEDMGLKVDDLHSMDYDRYVFFPSINRAPISYVYAFIPGKDDAIDSHAIRLLPEVDEKFIDQYETMQSANGTIFRYSYDPALFAYESGLMKRGGLKAKEKGMKFNQPAYGRDDV